MDWTDAALFFVGFLIAFNVGYWFGRRHGFLLGQLATMREVEKRIDEANVEAKIRSQEQRRNAPWQ